MNPELIIKLLMLSVSLISTFFVFIVKDNNVGWYYALHASIWGVGAILYPL